MFESGKETDKAMFCSLAKEKGIMLEKDFKKFFDEVKKEEGKARERLLDIEDVLKILEVCPKRLNCTKKSLEGAEIKIVSCADKFPRAYHYTPMCTEVQFWFKSGKWKFILASRCGVVTNSHGCVTVKLSQTAKDEILHNIERGDF